MRRVMDQACAMRKQRQGSLWARCILFPTLPAYAVLILPEPSRKYRWREEYMLFSILFGHSVRNYGAKNGEKRKTIKKGHN